MKKIIFIEKNVNQSRIVFDFDLRGTILEQIPPLSQSTSKEDTQERRLAKNKEETNKS